MHNKISRQNLPANPPTTFTLILLLGLDHFHAPGWMWGIVCTLLFVLWAAVLYTMSQCKEIDIFKKDTDDYKTKSFYH